MSDERAQLRARYSAPADRDLPPGRHLLHRENLMTQIQNEQPSRQPGYEEAAGSRSPRPLNWRPSARGLIATAAAVALVAGLGVTAAYRLSARTSGSATPPAAAAVLLDRIAQTAAAQPTIAIGPNQYFYVKVKVAPDVILPGKTIEEWIPQGNGKKSELKSSSPASNDNQVLPAGGGNMSLEPLTWMAMPEPDTLTFPSYAYLQSLPTNPRQLLDYIEEQLRTVYTVPNVSFNTFYLIGQLLFGSVVPPQTAAALYRAAALIPGVKVVPDATDALGRHGIGISMSVTPGSSISMEWMFSTTTYQLIGMSAEPYMFLPSYKVPPPVVSAILAKGVANTLGGTPTLIP